MIPSDCRPIWPRDGLGSASRADRWGANMHLLHPGATGSKPCHMVLVFSPQTSAAAEGRPTGRAFHAADGKASPFRPSQLSRPPRVGTRVRDGTVQGQWRFSPSMRLVCPHRPHAGRVHFSVTADRKDHPVAGPGRDGSKAGLDTLQAQGFLPRSRQRR